LGVDEAGEEARRLGAELFRVGLASPDGDQVHIVVAVAAPGDDAHYRSAQPLVPQLGVPSRQAHLALLAAFGGLSHCAECVFLGFEH
jgi:hypothetical protein